MTTIKNAGAVPNWTTGTEVCPGPLGGVEWNGPAYDRPNKALVVVSVDGRSIDTAVEGFQFKPGVFNRGGKFKFADTRGGWITALDADIGGIRWKYETVGPQVSGITPIAGGVIFAGDMKGNFYALASSAGRELYKTATGGAMAGGVIRNMRKGKQKVAADQATYAKICASGHGGQGEGVSGPPLQGLSKRIGLNKTIDWIENPSAKMPKLYPAPIDAQAVKNVAAYVQGL